MSAINFLGKAICQLLGCILLALFSTLPCSADEISLNGHTFQIPDGFTINLAASPPLVDRPISADFDELGRLYVTESNGSNEPVEEQLKKKPHRILRLEDTDNDGQFDKRTVFADKMMFPEGALWHAGSLYVAAPPSIWKLTDTDDDGVADQREEWFQGKTLTGCANDLHGPYLGRDGWIYWCKGAFAEQTHARPDGPPFVTRAAHIFRRHPSSQWVEPVMTGGMDNPVEVVFSPRGERFFTTTFVQHPGGGLRDAIIHAVYGGVYGKDHDVVNGHTRTGDFMPVMTHLGAAAPSGLALLESDQLGFGGNLVATLFNMRRITRYELIEQGSTFTTQDADLLVSDNLDFHPTDVIEDADGSLLVVDTGGWYKLCCPTSQLHKPDILGAIYRLRRREQRKLDDPRGLQVAWRDQSVEELLPALDDQRPVIRRRASDELVRRGESVVPKLSDALSESSARTGQNIVWTLTRISSDSSRAAVSQALRHPEATVRQAALHSISVRRDEQPAKTVAHVLLADPSPQVRRAAAEALGRIGGPAAVDVILNAFADVGDDRVLEHSLIYALSELGQPDAIYQRVRNVPSAAQRAALLALEQTGAGSLTFKDVLPFLSVDDVDLRKTVDWVVGRHPEWSPELSEHFEQLLAKSTPTADLLNRIELHLAKSAAQPASRDLAARILGQSDSPNTLRHAVLRAMASSRLDRLSTVWQETLLPVLETGDAADQALAIEVFRKLTPTDDGKVGAAGRLLHYASRKEVEERLRLAALAALPPKTSGISDRLLGFVEEYLTPEGELNERSLALDAISRAKLTLAQRIRLSNRLSTLGPLDLPRMLELLAQRPDEQLGKEIVAALEQSTAIGRVPATDLRNWFGKFPQPIPEQIELASNKRRANLAEQIQLIEELVPLVESGDIRNGQKVFHSSKTACNACHEMGYLGGDIGPDLTRIGRTRSPRDLLEAIVVPSASFVRSYEPWSVATTDGRIVSGVLRENSQDAVVLTTTDRKEIRIPRAEVEEMQLSRVSVMPDGLSDQLTRQEFADLVKFLLLAVGNAVKDFRSRIRKNSGR